MKELNGENFLTELSKCPLAIVDFWAPWCGFCTAIEDDYKALEEKYCEKISFFRLNVDVAEEIALDYGISFIPSFIILSFGEVVEKRISEINISGAEKMIKKAISENKK